MPGESHGQRRLADFSLWGYKKLDTTELMLKILQARLQQYVNREIPDVQAGFRKGRGTRDQIANIRWIMEKARGEVTLSSGLKSNTPI